MSLRRALATPTAPCHRRMVSYADRMAATEVAIRPPKASHATAMIGATPENDSGDEDMPLASDEESDDESDSDAYQLPLPPPPRPARQDAMNFDNVQEMLDSSRRGPTQEERDEMRRNLTRMFQSYDGPRE